MIIFVPKCPYTDDAVPRISNNAKCLIEWKFCYSHDVWSSRRKRVNVRSTYHCSRSTCYKTLCWWWVINKIMASGANGIIIKTRNDPNKIVKVARGNVEMSEVESLRKLQNSGFVPKLNKRQKALERELESVFN